MLKDECAGLSWLKNQQLNPRHNFLKSSWLFSWYIFLLWHNGPDPCLFFPLCYKYMSMKCVGSSIFCIAPSWHTQAYFPARWEDSKIHWLFSIPLLHKAKVLHTLKKIKLSPPWTKMPLYQKYKKYKSLEKAAEFIQKAGQYLWQSWCSHASSVHFCHVAIAHITQLGSKFWTEQISKLWT